MNVIKIAVIGIVGVLLALQLKEAKSALSVILSLATCLVIAGWTVVRMDTVLGMLKEIENLVSIHSAYITALLKMIGITYVSDFGAGLCKDAGHGTVAHQIEIFGKISILAVSMPVLTALIQTIEQLL